jgi:hypothetical protein
MAQIPPLADLVELAKEVELGDPIDWGMLSIGEDEAYILMASHLLELFDQVPDDQQFIVAIASMTKLLVENFTLNLKLQTK